MHKRPSWFWCHYKAHSCSMYNRQVFISIQRCTMFIRPLLKTYLEDLVKSLLMRLRLKTISISILSDALTNTPSEQISTLCKWCQCGISSYGVNPWVRCASGNVWSKICVKKIILWTQTCRGGLRCCSLVLFHHAVPAVKFSFIYYLILHISTYVGTYSGTFHSNL